jgi:hypothetical protein
VVRTRAMRPPLTSRSVMVTPAATAPARRARAAASRNGCTRASSPADPGAPAAHRRYQADHPTPNDQHLRMAVQVSGHPRARAARSAGSTVLAHRVPCTSREVPELMATG